MEKALLKELHQKYEKSRKEFNGNLEDFSRLFIESINKIKQYEAARTGIVMIGFDKLAAIFTEWANEVSNTRCVPMADRTQKLSMIDNRLEGIPTSWVEVTFPLQPFGDLMSGLRKQESRVNKNSLE